MPHEEGHPGKRASDANLAIMRQSFDAFDRGDMFSAADLMHDDIEWHEIGRSEPVMGKAALAARAQEPDAQSWNIKGEVHTMLADDDHGVSLVTATATKAGGESLTYKVAEIYHFKDGKISARWAFSDDTEAINRFFGS